MTSVAWWLNRKRELAAGLTTWAVRWNGSCWVTHFCDDLVLIPFNRLPHPQYMVGSKVIFNHQELRKPVKATIISIFCNDSCGLVYNTSHLGHGGSCSEEDIIGIW